MQFSRPKHRNYLPVHMAHICISTAVRNSKLKVVIFFTFHPLLYVVLRLVNSFLVAMLFTFYIIQGSFIQQQKKSKSDIFLFHLFAWLTNQSTPGIIVQAKEEESDRDLSSRNASVWIWYQTPIGGTVSVWYGVMWYASMFTAHMDRDRPSKLVLGICFRYISPSHHIYIYIYIYIYI